MGLFGLGKKKEEKETSSCCCQGGEYTPEEKATDHPGTGEAVKLLEKVRQ